MHTGHHIVGQKCIQYECIQSVPIWYARVAKHARQIPATVAPTGLALFSM